MSRYLVDLRCQPMDGVVPALPRAFSDADLTAILARVEAHFGNAALVSMFERAELDGVPVRDRIAARFRELANPSGGPPS